MIIKILKQICCIDYILNTNMMNKRFCITIVSLGKAKLAVILQ